MVETRWQYAWRKTKLVQFRRELGLAFVGSVLAVIAVSIWGSDDGAGDQLVAAIATFVGVFVLVPVGTLLWHLLRAPSPVKALVREVEKLAGTVESIGQKLQSALHAQPHRRHPTQNPLLAR